MIDVLELIVLDIAAEEHHVEAMGEIVVPLARQDVFPPALLCISSPGSKW